MNPARVPRLRHPPAPRSPSPRLSSSSAAHSATSAAPSATTATPSRMTLRAALSLSTPRSQPLKLALPSSRVLSYATYGPETGFPVLFLHGYPSSRLEVAPIAHLAHRHNLLLIAPDRPGYGRSTPYPGRRIGDYPADLAALASHLGLRRYAVLGCSGGGPYALACAHRELGLPRESLAAVGVLAGAPAWEAGTAQVTWGRKVLAVLSRWVPGPLRVGTQAVVGVLRWVLTRRSVERWVEGWLLGLGQKKRAEGKESGNDLQPAEQRGQLMDIVFEGFEQGAGAAVEEAVLLTDRDWGFRFEDVDFERVVIWHGAKDVNAPISMVRWMADRIPNARLKVFEEDSHYTVGEKLDEILEDLVAEERKGVEG